MTSWSSSANSCCSGQLGHIPRKNFNPSNSNVTASVVVSLFHLTSEILALATDAKYAISPSIYDKFQVLAWSSGRNSKFRLVTPRGLNFRQSLKNVLFRATFRGKSQNFRQNWERPIISATVACSIAVEVSNSSQLRQKSLTEIKWCILYRLWVFCSSFIIWVTISVGSHCFLQVSSEFWRFLPILCSSSM